MYETFFRNLSLDRMMEDTRYLTEETPMRLAGSEMERKAAAYIEKQFRDAGIPVELIEIDGYVSFPHSARVEVLSPVQRTIEARAFAQAFPTPPEGVEAELVFVGSGGLADYEGVDVEGRITLAALSYSPPRPEKVRLATVNGSIGQIMMNWGLPEHEVIPMGTCKAIWGNPSTSNVDRMPTIPAIGISKKDGNWLAELAAKGPVRVRMHCETENRWSKMVLPIARVEGSVEPEKFVLVNGHFDAWAGGATDNATGNAAMIEMARVFHQNRDKLRRSIVFAFWPGHESGIMEGSSWYADAYWDDLNRNCVGAMNLDSLGMLQASEYSAYCSRELLPFHQEVTEQVLGLQNHTPHLLARTGDQSFFGMGIPSMLVTHEHPDELKKAWAGAILGWWYHSEHDTMDKVDPDILLDGTKMATAYAARLVGDDVLPYDFLPEVERIDARAAELSAYDVDIDLSRIVSEIGTLKQNAVRLRERGAALEGANDPEQTARHNRVLQRVSRILTPITSTVDGKWTQDTYGLSALTTPLPGLFEIPKMAANGKDSTAFKLQWTETVRQRNRIADGLIETNEMLADYLGSF